MYYYNDNNQMPYREFETKFKDDGSDVTIRVSNYTVMDKINSLTPEFEEFDNFLWSFVNDDMLINGTPKDILLDYDEEEFDLSYINEL